MFLLLLIMIKCFNSDGVVVVAVTIIMAECINIISAFLLPPPLCMLRHCQYDYLTGLKNYLKTSISTNKIKGVFGEKNEM